MIVFSCHVLSDDDVRNAVCTAELLPRNAKQIYGCLGCSAECGRCARTIKTIIDEALGACAKSCCSGCPHSQAGTDAPVHTGLLLAASCPSTNLPDSCSLPPCRQEGCSRLQSDLERF